MSRAGWLQSIILKRAEMLMWFRKTWMSLVCERQRTTVEFNCSRPPGLLWTTHLWEFRVWVNELITELLYLQCAVILELTTIAALTDCSW